MKLAMISALAALFAMPAFAQSRCAPIDVVHEKLTGQFGEKWAATGTSAVGGRPVAVRFYINADTGTWTVVTILAGSGAACMSSAGQGFTMHGVSAVPQGDPA